MALISPGVEVQVFDDSAYASGATGTVPLLVIATEQDKQNITKTGIAAGTIKANANKLAIVSSQRELATLYGAPYFERTSSDTPVHGGERNEYGLMAAYSLLGVSNRVMTVRADIDMKQLKGTTVRPAGKPVDGIYWLDTASTSWGAFAWDASIQDFSIITPTVITSDTDLTSGVPNTGYGFAGDYVIVATSSIDPVLFYKTSKNTWVVVGSTTWQQAVPAVASTAVAPTVPAGSITINTIAVTLTGTTLASVAADINTAAITGVTAAIVNGFLEIYVTSAATGSQAIISSATAGLLTTIGLVAGTYRCPITRFDTHTNVPQWRTSDSSPRPSGSVWIKTSAVSSGTNLVLSQYNYSLNTFNKISTPLYAGDSAAIAGLDTSGGKLIPVGTVYTQYDTAGDGTVRFKLFRRSYTWPTTITGTVVTAALTAANSFRIQVSVAGSGLLTPSPGVTITISAGNTLTDVIAAINAAALPNLTASTVSGALRLSHGLGGVIVLTDTVVGTLAQLGITASTVGVRSSANTLIATGWTPVSNLNYAASPVKPSQEPEDGVLWYHNDYSQVDIMIHDGTASATAWKGYKNISSDARGFNLTLTDPEGVIISASMPITQSDGSSALALGDLWLDTSDLENYPKLSRWQTVKGVNRWVKIDNSDQASEFGIVFADARWDDNGVTDTVTGSLTTTKTLLNSDYLDLDAPNATAYPRGTLLFNTRRSGFGVKKYMQDYFNITDFSVDNWSNTLPYAIGNRVVFTNGKIYKCVQAVTIVNWSSSGTYALGNRVVYTTGATYVCIQAHSTTQTPNTATAYWTLVDTSPPKDSVKWSLLENSTWVNAAGNRLDGSPYMGHRAVRSIIVEAMKSAIDTSTEIREEQREFTLIACPGYPELIPNMVALNNDRRNTAFVIGDTSMRLAPVGTELQNWSEGTSSGNMYDEALRISDSYLGVYYPSALFNDLEGNTIAVPPSHMALRTLIRSDAVSFPWFAPAGTKRGLVDNASSLGYVNAQTGEFNTFGMSEGIRDTLYETKINPITFLPGVGITVYGQKTRSAITSALDRINVSRLVAYIRGRVDRLARPFIFEPNDKITRDQLKQIVEQMLNDLTAKRALYDYLVVCDTTNNTPVRIDRNELYLDIAIEPVKAVEFIYIPLRIKNTGSIASNF